MSSGELIGAAGPEPLPEVALSNKEMQASIHDAVASLDSTERAVIELAYDEGLSQSEIAARLGWPIGTVKTRTRRALRRLRERLEGPQVEATRHSPVDPAREAGRGGLNGWRAAAQVPTPAPCLSPC
jgi:hypothetical protein